jgi:hypothetical protein
MTDGPSLGIEDGFELGIADGTVDGVKLGESDGVVDGLFGGHSLHSQVAKLGKK